MMRSIPAVVVCAEIEPITRCPDSAASSATDTSSVANLIAEGKTSQLPLALDSGRKHGMVPLNDALVAFVQSGVVDAREAYRQAADRTGFLNQLKREGVDTSFIERLA